MCLRIHGNAHDFETEPFVQPCRRLGHGRVLDSGNDNARAAACQLFAIGFVESVDRPQAQLAHTGHGNAFDGKIIRFGATGGEDHVIWPGAQCRSERCACRVQRAGRGFARLVHTGRIGVGLSQERGHGLDDCRAHWFGGGGVQVQFAGFTGCVGGIGHD